MKIVVAKSIPGTRSGYPGDVFLVWGDATGLGAGGTCSNENSSGQGDE